MSDAEREEVEEIIDQALDRALARIRISVETQRDHLDRWADSQRTRIAEYADEIAMDAIRDSAARVALMEAASRGKAAMTG